MAISINKEIKEHLKQDVIFAQIIENYDVEETKKITDTYTDIIDAIISQQLSVKASATIYKRFLELFDGMVPAPADILSKEDQQLRTAGISFQKIKYLKSFATAIASGDLKLEELQSLSDEEVISELIKVKGIGRWTAEMILIFSLHRPDIFSIGDLGLRNAVAKHYGVNRDDMNSIAKISKKWAPYRSYASRYLWKSLDNMPKEKK